MVSAMLGGVAQGFIQGMDIRAQREAQAALLREKRKEAQLGREHAEDLQKRGFEHAEKQTEAKIADEQGKYTRVQAATAFRIVHAHGAKMGGKWVPVDTLPPALEAAIIDPKNGMAMSIQTVEIDGIQTRVFANPAFGIHEEGKVQKIIDGINKGDLDPNDFANHPKVIESLRNQFGLPTVQKGLPQLLAIAGRPYNVKKAASSNLILQKMNMNPEFSYETLKDQNGKVIPQEFVQFPKSTAIAAGHLGMGTPEQIARLLTNKHWRALANLGWFNRKLTALRAEGKSNEPLFKYYQKYVKENFRNQYIELIGTNGRFLGPDRNKEGLFEWNYGAWNSNLKEIATVFSDSPISRKPDIAASFSGRIEDTDILKHTFELGGHQYGTYEEFLAAFKADKIRIIRQDFPGSDRSPERIADDGKAGDDNRRGKRVLELPDESTGTGKRGSNELITVQIDGGHETKIHNMTQNEIENSIPNVVDELPAKNMQGNRVSLKHWEKHFKHNKEFKDAVSMDMHKEHSTSWFRNMPDSFKAKYEYYKQKGLYKTMDTLLKNETAQNWSTMYTLMDELFDFSEIDPQEKRRAINMSIAVAAQERLRLSDVMSRTPETSRIGESQIIHTPVMKVVPFDDIPADTSKGRIKKGILEQNEKINKVDAISSALEDTTNKLGALSIAETFSNPDKIMEAVNIILKEKQLDLSDKELMQRVGIDPNTFPGLATMKAVLSELGTRQSGEIQQKVNVAFQFISDLATAGRLIFDKAGIATREAIIGSSAASELYGRGRTEGERRYKDKVGSLSYKNFSSIHDTRDDYMTKSRLKMIEDMRRKQKIDYQDTVGRSVEALRKLGGESVTEAQYNSLDSDQKRERAFHQAKIAQAYLKARQSALKVSLTYFFAGLVQGESGGRAISNEDFAILFRALWANGAGGNIMKGGFSVIKEVMSGMKDRNTMLQNYLGWGHGTRFSDKMLKLLRASQTATYKDPKSGLMHALWRDRDKPIPGMGSMPSSVQNKVIALPKQAMANSSLAPGVQKDLRIKYNAVIGPLRTKPSKYSVHGNRSIMSYTAPNWESLNDNNKKEVSDITISNFTDFVGKIGKHKSQAVSILDSFRYNHIDKEIGVGTAFLDLYNSKQEGGSKPTPFKQIKIHRIIEEFVKDFFNSSRDFLAYRRVAGV